jgi:hypothetical protein
MKMIRGGSEIVVFLNGERGFLGPCKTGFGILGDKTAWDTVEIG